MLVHQIIILELLFIPSIFLLLFPVIFFYFFFFLGRVFFFFCFVLRRCPKNVHPFSVSHARVHHFNQTPKFISGPLLFGCFRRDVSVLFELRVYTDETQTTTPDDAWVFRLDVGAYIVCTWWFPYDYARRRKEESIRETPKRASCIMYTLFFSFFFFFLTWLFGSLLEGFELFKQQVCVHHPQEFFFFFFFFYFTFTTLPC